MRLHSRVGITAARHTAAGVLCQLLRHGSAVRRTHTTTEEAAQPVLLLLLLLLLVGSVTPDGLDLLAGVTREAIVPAVPIAGGFRVGAAFCITISSCWSRVSLASRCGIHHAGQWLIAARTGFKA
jgi:hypothetical protein